MTMQQQHLNEVKKALSQPIEWPVYKIDPELDREITKQTADEIAQIKTVMAELSTPRFVLPARRWWQF